MTLKINTYIGSCLAAMIVFLMISCASSMKDRVMEARLMDSINLAEAMADSTYEFESDTLSAASLEAFEVRAAQKLGDAFDYIQLLSDSTLDISFKKQAALMMTGLFWDKTTLMDTHFDHSLNGEKLEVAALSDKLLEGYFPKLKIDITNIETTMRLTYKKDKSYRGQLTFQRTVYQIDKSTQEKISHTSMKATMVLKRVRKDFGDMSKEIWEVLLGDIEVTDPD